MIRGCIFDLDGVIVDTAKYHFLAWQRLAVELAIPFTEADNENLKGVSRVASLEFILNLGGKSLSEEAFASALDKKNRWYLEYIEKLDQSEILPGVIALLDELEASGIKIALGSASKNAKPILERLGLIHRFQAIIDGTSVSAAKPDPEVFLKAAEALSLPAESCIVFEDAAAGIQAALNANMRVIGVGEESVLAKAHRVVPNLANQKFQQLVAAA